MNRIFSVSCLWIDFVLRISASLSNCESVPTILLPICNSNCSRLAKHIHAAPDRLILYGQVRRSVQKRRKWAERPKFLQVWSSLWIPSKAFFLWTSTCWPLGTSMYAAFRCCLCPSQSRFASVEHSISFIEALQ